MGRLYVLVLAVAGCSFQHGAAGEAAAVPDAKAIDARMIDARMIDAAKPIDACPDADGDGVCDAVDTWPCGPQPAAPGTTVAMTGNSGATNVSLTAIAFAGSGQLVVAAPGATVTYTMHYAITDTACPGDCIDQIEIGFVAGGRYDCPFDGTVSKATGETGTINTTIKVPTTAGNYDIRTNIGQNFSCTSGGATGWWNATPGAAWTVAKLCVH